jgi:two-component system chemotaxis response regulator CheY
MIGAQCTAVADDLDIIEAKPWSVLIAEDSRIWRSIIRAGIEDFGPHLHVIEAPDGQRAVEILSEQRIDIAFVDLAMPGFNGDEVVRQVQAHGRMPFFVTVSATSDAQAIARMRELSAYDYLAKPFGMAAVKRILTTYERMTHPSRVLIVDDSRTARSIIARILSRSVFHFEIEQAADGVSAFELYAKRPADIVFLDLNMPGIDGLQTLRLLRALNSGVRVVLMSGSPDALDRLQGMGAAGLRKPFLPQDLDRVMHRLFQLPLPYSDQS